MNNYVFHEIIHLKCSGSLYPVNNFKITFLTYSSVRNNAKALSFSNVSFRIIFLNAKGKVS